MLNVVWTPLFLLSELFSIFLKFFLSHVLLASSQPVLNCVTKMTFVLISPSKILTCSFLITINVFLNLTPFNYIFPTVDFISFFFLQNLPHDAYKLLAVPSPIGGVLVIGANTIHYHSQVCYLHDKLLIPSWYSYNFLLLCFMCWLWSAYFAVIFLFVGVEQFCLLWW